MHGEHVEQPPVRGAATRRKMKEMPLEGDAGDRGLEVAVMSFIALAMTIAALAVNFTVGSDGADTTNTRRYEISVTPFTLCGKRMAVFSSGGTANEADIIVPEGVEGCYRLEDSICSKDAFPVVHFVRLFDMLTIFTTCYLCIFGVLDRVGCFKRFGFPLQKCFPSHAPRQHYICVAWAPFISSILGFVLLFVLWGQMNCIGAHATLAPGFIIHGASLLCTFAILIVAVYYRRRPDYAQITKDMEAFQDRIQNSERKNREDADVDASNATVAARRGKAQHDANGPGLYDQRYPA